MEVEKTEELEVNIKDLFYALMDKIWVLFFAALICALSAGIITKLTQTPEYAATAKLYIINRQNPDSTVTSSDLSTGSLLIKDFEILVTSRPIIEQVIHNLNLSLSQDQLVSKISVNIPEETRILEITVRNTDPFIAKNLADEIADVSAEQMISVMDIEKVNIVERGRIPLSPAENDFTRNLMLGGMAGFGIAALIICIFYISNDHIKTNEDIEKQLGIISLAEIPLEDNLNAGKVRAELKKPHKGGLKNAVD